MVGRVDGKIALITGASSGIGRGTALTLAREGAVVIGADMQSGPGATLVEEIAAAGGEAVFLSLDVTREPSWISLIEQVRTRFGRLDVLVNNAGIGLSGPVTDMTLEDWRRQTAVNIDGVFLGVKHALPLMRESGGGSIVNVSSIAALRGAPNASGYCATKAAVRLFTQSVALECAALNDGVRVNSIHPGIVETPIWDTLLGTSGDGSNSRPRGPIVAELTARTVPLGRSGTIEEIAAGILYLASDEARYTTGSALVIDGGRSIS
jgi:NAD(P)-dependent dehydrogenase (short-subunit alcohol dehydrogenase family)